jgi:hypothetical protein
MEAVSRARPGWYTGTDRRGEGGYVRRYLSVLALVAVLGLVAAACGGDDEGGTGATGATATGTTGELQPGGTVELGMLGDVSASFDPQKEYY